MCAAALVTTISALDRLTATESSLDALTFQDRKAVHRNLHVVAAGATPTASGAGGAGAAPQTFFLDVHNLSRKDALYELRFGLEHLGGELAVMLDRRLALPGDAMDGFRRLTTGKLQPSTRKHLGAWTKAASGLVGRARAELARFAEEQPRIAKAGGDQRLLAAIPRRDPRLARIAKLEHLDPDRLMVASAGRVAALRVGIPAGGPATLALTWTPPRDARPGDRYRMDIVQRGKRRAIVGGSSYVLVVTRPRGW